MATYKVKVYYEYAMEVEVEADSIKDAYDKGIEIADEMDESNLQFISSKDTEVYTNEGSIIKFDENGKYIGIDS